MARYRIESKQNRDHVLKCLETGKRITVDLFVNGDIEMEGFDNARDDYTEQDVIDFENSLVGKEVEIKDLHPVVFAGMGVKVLKQI